MLNMLYFSVIFGEFVDQFIFNLNVMIGSFGWVID